MVKYGSHTGLINLEACLDAVDAVANSAMINTALKLHELLRSSPPVGTPIDTAWASTNWIMSVDKPSESPVGTKQSIVRTDPGIAAVLQFDIKQNRTIFVQNNTPYIARLNRGWSKQSPAGFVETAIDGAMLATGQVGGGK